jgi:hypothetical protein
MEFEFESNDRIKSKSYVVKNLKEHGRTPTGIKKVYPVRDSGKRLKSVKPLY